MPDVQTAPPAAPAKSKTDTLKDEVSALKARLAKYEDLPVEFQEFPKVVYLHPKDDAAPVVQPPANLPGAQGIPVGTLVGSQPQPQQVLAPKEHISKVVANADEEKQAKAEGYVNQPFVPKV